MKISKLFLTLICLMLCLAIAISFSSCEKTNIENEKYFDPDDPDEIGYAVDDSDDENDGDGLNERGSTFKITSVTSDDSLPILNTQTGKKQKYGKRQIVYEDKKTKFYIKGYGFGAINDSSYVKAYVKNVDKGNMEIVSWSDSNVVVLYPMLTESELIQNTFSIKFKLFRSNTKAGKPNISRVKSKSCISYTKAKDNGYIKVDNKVFQNITSAYTPQVGDYLKRPNGLVTQVTIFTFYNTSVGGIVYTSELNTAGLYKAYTYQYKSGKFTGYIGNIQNVAEFTMYSR